MNPFFPGFSEDEIDVGGARLHLRRGGSGPPVVLLHGHPRTHATWHGVAPLLAEAHAVVCPDLRGYGRSSKPADAPDHASMSKRALATDIDELMQRLGHPRYAVVGHDRGAYVAFRAALDRPERITHLAVLDAIPIADALARCDAPFAQAWWHWFFFAQPDKPERAISADPDAWYGRPEAKRRQMGDAAYADYRAAIHDPATVHAMLEDYRAGLGVDRAHDEASRHAGQRVACPLLVLWAEHDDLEALHGDPLAVWRPWAAQGLQGRRLPCGHHMAEEAPAELAAELRRFLGT
jgi:haloacetate dehalogenase